MQFRADINGLRAIAVIAVMLFHFNESWLPGGFAGVDVFFVISGFLMTGVIFKGLEEGRFSLLKFYAARANRIIPALAFLCFIMLVFGVFFLAPTEYEVLGSHVASSLGFISNMHYWRESGYFDAASNEKWLLHTWSLSVEWQFYIIYPVVLVVLNKAFSLSAIKKIVLFSAISGFIFCVTASYIWPSPAYYLLPTRAWEMLVGGLAILYPFNVNRKRCNIFVLLGFCFILVSFFLFSSESVWPGYLAIFPVIGTFLIIQAQKEKSVLISNFVFKKIGMWSYSIYLWHWPIVVFIYYYSLSNNYLYIGVILSVFMGFISNKYIEKIKFTNDHNGLGLLYRYMPIYFVLIVGGGGFAVMLERGFIERAPLGYRTLVDTVKPSPYRNACHISDYRRPVGACEYFEGEVGWAVLGDSHSVEIAYALAEKLKMDAVGVKQFSFSSCKPSFKENESFSKCSRWYNEAIEYIQLNQKINNVVLNHRFTAGMFGGDASIFPEFKNNEITKKVERLTDNVDELIRHLAKTKDNVYVFYPIPELKKNVNRLISNAYNSGESLEVVEGTTVEWYERRNEYMIHHFDTTKYPENVKLLKPQDVFCDSVNCYAVRNGEALYFDDDHPSIAGAKKLVNLIE